jgi:hypothetical protein
MATENLPKTESPLVGLGMASLVLGVIGMMLFLLPILGIPISSFGLLFGLVGIVTAFLPTATSMRWSLAGTAASALALAINIGIVYAPADEQPNRKAPQLWRPVPDRPYVPPPARP